LTGQPPSCPLEATEKEAGVRVTGDAEVLVIDGDEVAVEAVHVMTSVTSIPMIICTKVVLRAVIRHLRMNPRPSQMSQTPTTYMQNRHPPRAQAQLLHLMKKMRLR